MNEFSKEDDAILAFRLEVEDWKTNEMVMGKGCGRASGISSGNDWDDYDGDWRRIQKSSSMKRRMIIRV
jgi:hypothetical protein